MAHEIEIQEFTGGPVSSRASPRESCNNINATLAETREQLGGYYLIEAKDVDEAMGMAERIPVAKVGRIEIRPRLEIPGLPDSKKEN
jgi:hypothetical protein